MRNIFLIISSFLLYFIFIFSSSSLVDSMNARRYLYYFPNGYIFNTDSENFHLLGYNIYSGEKLPEMNLEIRDSEIDSEKEKSGLYSLFRIFQDFKFYFSISLVFFSFSLWFLLIVGDFLISSFFLIISVLFFSLIYVLGFNSFYLIFYFSLIVLSFMIVHLSFRLKGKELGSKWTIPELALAGLLSYIGYAGRDNSVIFDKLILITILLYIVSTIGILGVVIYDIIKYRNFKSNHLPRKILITVLILFLVYTPLLSVYSNIFKDNINYHNVLFSSFILFPFVFTYGTMRYSFIKQQLYFGSTVTLFFLSLFLVILYLIIYKLIIYLDVDTYYILSIYNTIFLSICLFYASSIKSIINNIIEYYTFDKNNKLMNALEDMAGTISSPMTMKSTAKQLMDTVIEVLGVEKAYVLVPLERFPDIEFKDISVIKIAENSPIWEYFIQNKDITITSNLVYGSGNREDAHTFLSNLNIQIAYPMLGLDEGKKVSSVFLIGEKKNHKNFSLGELKFIKETTRLADLLLQNYLLLISDVEKKKMERDLATVEIMQKTINPLVFDSERIEDLEFGYISIPAVGISGDYMDFIKTNDSRLWIFIGDVSGHGVGSGFLVSAIKAFVQDQVNQNLEIQKIFQNLNKFLLDRYAGNEFMSLFGGIYDPKSAMLDYINAGHISPVMYRGPNYRFKLRGGDRLLGVLPTVFSPEKVQFAKKDRLFLYSDGVTETFNSADETYGETRLLDFIKTNYGLDSEEIVKLVVKDIEAFRKDAEISDDLSLICLTKIL